MSVDYKTLLGLVREFVDSPEIEAYTDAGKELMDRARAAAAPSSPKPTNDARILHMMAEEDPCCSKHFHRAAKAGQLDPLDRWDCPACRAEWKMTLVAGVHFWEPVISMEVFHLP